MDQAESDLAASKLLSTAGLHAQAIWCAAQAVEKGHKAILAALGLRYEDRHFKNLGHSTGEVAKLLPAALHEPVDPQIALLIAALETRASSSRYPSPVKSGAGAVVLEAPAKTMTDSTKDVSDAGQLLGWCRERILRAARATTAMGPIGT
jgi:HEPN domain-containing protein